MLNPERINPNSPYLSPNLAWKWEKKHWLLVISLACLALWWFGTSMFKVNLIKQTVDLLPAVGGLCFAADSIIKLTQ